MKKHQIFLLIALFFVTVFVFYPVLKADFIELDDKLLVVNNWKIKSFSFENLKELLFKPHYSLYHPLVNLSFAAEYSFFGQEPYFYHADNLILHLLNILLVFFIFRIITRNNFPISFITALIFACHPMHVEPVAWASSRKDVLYAFFFLLSLLFYLKARDDEKYKNRFYLFSLVFFCFSCLSKSMAVTLPAVLVLTDWLLGRKFDKKSILFYIPYFLVAVLFSALTYSIYYDPSMKTQFNPYGLFVNFVSAHFNFLFYLYKFLIPSKLAVMYPFFFPKNELMPNFIMMSPALVYSSFILVLYSLRRTKVIFFAAAFFLITILPVINILPAGSSPVADRYTYIPFIGLGYVFSVCIVFIYGKLNLKYLKYSFGLLISAVLILMCFASNIRAGQWLNTKTLFDSQIKTYPGQVSKAYTTRALYFLNDKNMRKEFERDIETAFSIDPSESLAKLLLAGINGESGRYGEALSLYARFSKYEFSYITACINRIRLLDITGKADEAELLLKTILEDPQKDVILGYESIYAAAGEYYMREGEYDKALGFYEQAEKYFPADEKIYVSIGSIYEKQGDFESAAKIYEEGISHCGEREILLKQLAGAYFNFHRFDNCEKTLKRAMELFPEAYECYDMLGNIYALKNDYTTALKCFTMAVLIKNDFGQAYFHRAVLYFKIKKYDKAKDDIEKAQKSGFDVPKDFLELLNEIKDN